MQGSTGKQSAARAITVRKRHMCLKSRGKASYSLWETTWFFPTPPQSNQSLLGLCFQSWWWTSASLDFISIVKMSTIPGGHVSGPFWWYQGKESITELRLASLLLAGGRSSIRGMKGAECALEPPSPRGGAQPNLPFVLLVYTCLALVLLPVEQRWWWLFSEPNRGQPLIQSGHQFSWCPSSCPPSLGPFHFRHEDPRDIYQLTFPLTGSPKVCRI